jgi:hypothetical protein
VGEKHSTAGKAAPFARETQSLSEKRRRRLFPGTQCSNPNTATELVVPTNTLPPAMVGVMYLLPVPNWSRLPVA